MPPSPAEGNPHGAPAPYLTFPDEPLEMGVGRAVNGTVGNDVYYDGIIDEVYFWERALSEAEVGELAAGAILAVEGAADGSPRLKAGGS